MRGDREKQLSEVLGVLCGRLLGSSLVKAAHQTPKVFAVEASCKNSIRNVAPAAMYLPLPNLAASARGVGQSEGPAPKLDPRPSSQKVQEGGAPSLRGASVACDYN